MADMMALAPILLQIESGARYKMTDGKGKPYTLPLAKQWEYAVKKGYSNKASDRGGPTFCGITLYTYKSYCRKKGKPNPSVYDLRRITLGIWLDVLRMFWDRMHGDEISNQSVANLCVDNVFNTGASYIKQIQVVLGVEPDGIVGSKTVAAINSANQRELFAKLYEKRRLFYMNLILAKPDQEENRGGWMNRLANYKFEEGGDRR